MPNSEPSPNTTPKSMESGYTVREGKLVQDEFVAERQGKVEGKPKHHPEGG